MHLIQVTIVVFSGQGECPIASVQWLTLVKLVRVPRNFVGRPASVYSGVTASESRTLLHWKRQYGKEPPHPISPAASRATTSVHYGYQYSACVERQAL